MSVITIRQDAVNLSLNTQCHWDNGSPIAVWMQICCMNNLYIVVCREWRRWTSGKIIEKVVFKLIHFYTFCCLLNRRLHGRRTDRVSLYPYSPPPGGGERFRMKWITFDTQSRCEQDRSSTDSCIGSHIIEDIWGLSFFWQAQLKHCCVHFCAISHTRILFYTRCELERRSAQIGYQTCLVCPLLACSPSHLITSFLTQMSDWFPSSSI